MKFLRAVPPLLMVLFLMTSHAVPVAAVEFDATPPGARWSVTTRLDYRVRIDDRYLGHADREIRETYRLIGESDAGAEVEGWARVLGSTKKDGRPVATRLESSEAVDFLLTKNGAVVGGEGRFPRLRGFPTFPEGEIIEGDRWEAPIGVAITTPEGKSSVLDQIASYTYLGRQPYMGRDAHHFEVLWATRYRGYGGDLSGVLDNLEGSHRVTLVVDAETGSPLMARDSLKERWAWSDSRVEEREGFALIFWEGVPPLDVEDIARQFDKGLTAASDSAQISGRSAENEGIQSNDGASSLDEGVVIVPTPAGLSVTLHNLHFVADKAVILSEDRPLLDELARVLQKIPDRTVVVRGHTADVGRAMQEYALSEERAKSVADELVRRGIDPRRLVYEGAGADEPLAPNDSEEGRQLNRRVELIIIED